ncbi:hypothetical protein [Hymenobacter actinosclerus]|uniref:Uncharacterized protein n=1 Tax=Hymenobacter actinosclerus TaxID=82805 RepID=A0A1I0DNC3_9BACT|nr:hypothetical protein [Hymenobacter actinosclerus]SET34030.1 hypothetical protein SAMN04487998_1482 [Hymenobacter actinosclerus]
MEITFEVPAERVAFMLEMLRSLSFVSNPRPINPAAVDTTAYLSASPANAERLQQAYEQFDAGQRVDFSFPAE